ncbi:glycosyltransferase [Candidatus Parvarchaeota archaeon]|nr:glycosyltransferase [Candidatus Parvarchaeota archaeon]
MGDRLISVVIPTYNEENYIEDLLKSIKAQTYNKYDIIVADSSNDSTPSIAKKYGARVIKVPKTNIATARNAGIKKADGDIIALIDADYILSKDVFRRVVAAFDKNKKLVCVEPSPRIGLKDLRFKDRLKFRVVNAFVTLNKTISFFGPLPAAYGCDFCLSSAIKKAGLFNENIDVCEDKEFFSRLRLYGRFKLIRKTVRVSYRRHAKEGVIKTGLIYFMAALSALLARRFKFRFKAIRRKKKG